MVVNTNSSIKLSVVIPAYNESKNIQAGVLEKVEGYLKNQSYKYEVIIVDDGSSDDTVKLVEARINKKDNFHLIKNPHGGKAQAVISGILASKGEMALFTDMDQATPLDQIEKFSPKFKEGFDIVIGSRQGREGAPILRKISAVGFSVLRNTILGLPFSDTQCGFKAFNRKAVEEIFPKVLKIWETMKASTGAVNAGFDVEVLFMAKQLGFKIAEVPVEWHYVDTERVQFVKDAIEAIKDMLRIRLNQVKGAYA